MEFTVNLTTETLCRATDWCGVKSGRDIDKWKETGLTPEPWVKVRCPHIAESLKISVKSIIPPDQRDMFIAEVLGVLADERYLDPETGAF